MQWIKKYRDQFLEIVEVQNLDDCNPFKCRCIELKYYAAVESRNHDGLSYKEFSKLLNSLASGEKEIRIEIKILNHN